MGSTWVVAYANPNILDLKIEAMGAPIIASLLCLLPMCAPFAKRLRWPNVNGRLDNIFVTAIGLLTILNIVYKLFLTHSSGTQVNMTEFPVVLVINLRLVVCQIFRARTPQAARPC